MTKIKICCIASLEEMELAVSRGASAVGLVSHMPSGPGVISEEKIAEIANAAPSDIETFLLTALTDPDEIIAQHRRCSTTTLQLVDRLPKNGHAALRRALPEVKLVQVIHVLGESSILEAKMIAPNVDALLLDSGNPNLEVKELGGTGRTHNWDVSRQIVEEASVPVWLAGGLNPDNATEAVSAVQPHGLDICSGVRIDGRLDENLLSAFVAAATIRS